MKVAVPLAVNPEVAVIKPEIVGVAVQAVPVTVKFPPREVRLLPETVKVLSNVVAPCKVKVPGVVTEPIVFIDEAPVPKVVDPDDVNVVKAPVPAVVAPILVALMPVAVVSKLEELTVKAPVPKVKTALLLVVPGRETMAEAVAVAPRLRALVISKGVKAPEFLCQKLTAEVALHEGAAAPLLMRTWPEVPAAVTSMESASVQTTPPLTAVMFLFVPP